jgi:hypothetical protein
MGFQPEPRQLVSYVKTLCQRTRRVFNTPFKLHFTMGTVKLIVSDYRNRT